ncbi:vascular cell adhesion protein 1-like [Arapaima gigas]
MALTLMAMFIIPAAGLSWVSLSPKQPVWRAGDRGELRCRAAGCPDEASFSWTSLEDKPLYSAATSNASESTLSFERVRPQHENLVLCRVTCGGQTKQQRAKIRVYSFPKEPEITGSEEMLAGEDNTLTCTVPDVYPPENLRITWLQGETVLLEEVGKEGPMTNVSSKYAYHPTADDDGTAITCRASHDLEGVPADQSSKETSAILNVLYAPEDIRISEATVVQEGGSFTLTCEADGKPKPEIQWRKLGEGGHSVTLGRNGSLVVLEAMPSHAGEYECEMSNAVGRKAASVRVAVQGPPRNTSIVVSPGGELTEGDRVTISCHSQAVPAARVVLRRVSDPPGSELGSSHDSSVSVTLSPVGPADAGMYECEASNRFGSQKHSAVLHVAAFPLEVDLSPGDGVIAVEMGSSLLLSCGATGCPNPTFFWKSRLDGPVRSQVESRGALSTLLLTPAELMDDSAYTCEVHCGSVRRSRHTEIKVFSFPTDPVIESAEALVEGQRAAIRCAVRDVFPAGLLQIQWLHQNGDVLLEDGPFDGGLRNVTSTLSFAPGSGDQGKRITCRVTLNVEAVPRNQSEKSVSTTINLHYPPRNTSIVVSPAGELKEGDHVTVTCVSYGAPAGRITLRRVSEGHGAHLQSSSGTSVSVTLSPARLVDAGLYECEASNPYGTQKAKTQLNVKAPPRNTTVEVFPSRQVQEGQNITICCRSISFPPPAVILKKMDTGKELYSPDGTFLLLNLTTNDTGSYLVNVTNDLGYETEIFVLQVMERSSSPQPRWHEFIVPAVGLVTTVTTASLIIHYLRKARMKGSYELAKCTAGAV